MKRALDDLQNVAEVDITFSKDWSAFDLIVIPSLNVEPGCTDVLFARYTKQLFEKHLKNLKFKEEAQILFGQNMRGLITMFELGKIHQNLVGRMFTISSIYYVGNTVSAGGLSFLVFE